MQPWIGAVAAGVTGLGALAAGPVTARWASGVDVRLPAAVMSASAVLAGFVVGARLGLVPALGAFVVLAFVSALLVGIDIRLHRLPDRLTLSSAVVGIVLLAIAALADDGWADLGRAVLGGLALLATYAVMYVAARAGFGAGDVKFAGVLGMHLAWLGWPTLVLGGVAGFCVGGLVSAVALAARRATLQTRMPFGPSMVAGAFLAIAVGNAQATTLLGW